MTGEDWSRLGDALLALVEARVLIAGPDGKILAASESAAGFFGCRREDLVGREAGAFGLGAPGSASPLDRKTRVLRRADGREARQHVRLSALDKGAGGETLFLYQLSDPPTEMERNLRESERRYRDLVEMSMHLIWAIDAQGRYTFVNRRASMEILGYAPEEMIGRPFTEFQPAGRARHDMEVFARTKEKDEAVYGYESELVRKDGRTVNIRSHSVVLHDENGNVVGITGAAQDITDRLRSENALRESERRYRELVETAHDLIWSLDAEGRITFVNQAAKRILGYEPEEMLGRRLTDFLPPEHARDAEKVLDRIRTGVAVSRYEIEHRRKDGTPVYLSYNGIVRRDGEGRILGTTGTAHDISEWRRSDEALRHAQKLESLGVVAGGIAHDFNNLLVGVLGNAGLAEKELPSLSPVRRYLANIAKAAQRAADLTRQLLAYSGKGQFVIKAVSLNEVVRDMADLIEVSLPKKVSLALHLAPDLPYVAADSGQIQQVVLNLVTNGAEATGGEGGLVTITTGVQHLDRDSLTDFSGWHVEPGKFVFVEVTDTGAGMATGILEKIFDPFYTTKATGRGLGLAAVLGIVRGHRGAIHVYTEIGRGSSFKVFFPVTEEVPRVEEPAHPEVGWRGRGTVLVVDDDAEVRIAASLILEYAGFQTRVASGGDEAIRVFSEDPGQIVAILLDMTMPGKCGEETFRALRRVRPDVKVILSSGYNEHEATERFVGRGLAGFIQKPYTPDALISAFRTVLSGEPPEPGPG